MVQEPIVLEKKESIAILTLNRPEKLNALNRLMIGELLMAFDEVRKDDTTRVLIITGSGHGFCSGYDVSEMDSIFDEEIYKSMEWKHFEPIGLSMLQLLNIGKTTIAAINGAVAGAGFSLSLLCDFRVASVNAKFTTAFVKRGLIPDCGATFMLPRIIGLPKALELCYSGDVIDAYEAEKIGLVTKVVLGERLIDECMQLYIAT